MEGFGKIERVVLKEEGIILTLSTVIFLWVFGVGVGVDVGVYVYVLFICTICISIICVSQEEPSLIASNQQIYINRYNFYKWIIFWKEKTLWKVNFWYQWIIHLII